MVVPEELEQASRVWGARADDCLLLEGQTVRAAFALADVIRPESCEAVAMRMSLSTIIVAINAQTLRRLELQNG